MTQTMNQVESIWNFLSTQAANAAKLADSRISNLYLMNDVDLVSGKRERSFVFFTPNGSPFVNTNYKNVVVIATPTNHPSPYVQVALRNDALYDLFLVMTGDIIDRVSTVAVMEQENCFFKYLAEWLNFLNKTPDKILSAQEQIGLYGELYFLRDLLKNNINPIFAIQGWVGSDGADKDFQYSGYGIEVKSSSKQDRLVHISNIRQLDDAGCSALFLQYYSFATIAGGADTLPEIVGQIRSILGASVALQDFDSNLIHRMYFDHDADKYTTSYSPVFEETYVVNSVFPRIIPSNVMVGVIESQYTIDLNVIQPIPVKTNGTFITTVQSTGCDEVEQKKTSKDVESIDLIQFVQQVSE